MTHVNRVQRALTELRQGRMVAIEDDDPRRDAYLCMAAGLVTPEAINFMVKHARGIICVALSAERCWALGLRQMLRSKPDPPGFMVTIEAREGVTTGISAHDRARTILAAARSEAAREDVVSPGHVLPVQARSGGVLEHAGYAEAAVELAALSGETPAAAVCAIMKDDGTMVRRPDVGQYCRRHGIHALTISDLVAYRRARLSEAVSDGSPFAHISPMIPR